MEGSVDEEKISRIMSEVKSFPGMPFTASKILLLGRDPDFGTSEIEDILKYDPGLTANILKLTNSAYFGLASPVSSLRQACMLLGWKRILQLAMTMCMSTLMKKPVPGYDLPHGELWRHSVAASVAAEALVRFLSLEDADEAFTAALLHDIGKFVLGNCVREDLEKIKEMVAKGLSFEVAEYIVLGMNHAHVGGRILKNWSLPPKLVGAVRWHHDPEKCERECIFSDLVHVADMVAHRAGFGKGRNGSADPSFEVIERLDLAESHLQHLADETLKEMNKLTEMATLS